MKKDSNLSDLKKNHVLQKKKKATVTSSTIKL